MVRQEGSSTKHFPVGAIGVRQRCRNAPRQIWQALHALAVHTTVPGLVGACCNSRFTGKPAGPGLSRVTGASGREQGLPPAPNQKKPMCTDSEKLPYHRLRAMRRTDQHDKTRPGMLITIKIRTIQRSSTDAQAQVALTSPNCRQLQYIIGERNTQKRRALEEMTRCLKQREKEYTAHRC